MKIQHLLAIVAIAFGASTTASAHKVSDIELHIDAKGPHLSIGHHRHKPRDHGHKPRGHEYQRDYAPRYDRPYRRAAKLERRAQRAFNNGRPGKAYRLMRRAYEIRVEADGRRASRNDWHPRHKRS